MPIKDEPFIAVAAFGAGFGAFRRIHKPCATVDAEVGAEGVVAVGWAAEGWKEKDDHPKIERWVEEQGGCTPRRWQSPNAGEYATRWRLVLGTSGKSQHKHQQSEFLLAFPIFSPGVDESSPLLALALAFHPIPTKMHLFGASVGFSHLPKMPMKIHPVGT